MPECTLGRAGGGDRCGSRLGPAMPSGVAGSSTRPAISQVGGGRLGFEGCADHPAEAYSARTGGFTSPRAVAAAAEAAACGSMVGAAAADAGGRLVSRTGGLAISRGASAAAQEAVALGNPAFEEAAMVGGRPGPEAGGFTSSQPAGFAAVVVSATGSEEDAAAASGCGVCVKTLLVECDRGSVSLHAAAEPVQSQVEELLGYFTSAPGALADAEVQAFMHFWCEADFAKYMSPEQAAVALEVQRVLRVGQGRSGGAVGEVSISGVSAGSCSGRSDGAVSEVVTSAGSEDSCSSRSSSGSSSRRPFPPRSPGMLDPLADLLTAGDDPAFVAYAKQNAAKRLVAEDVSAAEAFSWHTSSVAFRRAGFRGRQSFAAGWTKSHCA